ncbi:PREDICTED: uncharacterized protein LOC107067206 [Polistes dominula]|uniref:Uncharacterized protein LOC107067206 n=1 Tax=Polistes dominula TaxID=743375 RepID=A0ABM1ICQ0_POLDO|nr:PREDICTED: uncharacterized protein LOC107067206 [Polistes dominula]
MKSYNFRLTLLLILIPAVVHLKAQEYCPPENCLPQEQCNSTVSNASCLNGNECCSIVKSEYRTHCHHFSGICMNKCGDVVTVKQAVVDCQENERCCILV